MRDSCIKQAVYLGCLTVLSLSANMHSTQLRFWGEKKEKNYKVFRKGYFKNSMPLSRSKNEFPLNSTKRPFPWDSDSLEELLSWCRVRLELLWEIHTVREKKSFNVLLWLMLKLLLNIYSVIAFLLVFLKISFRKCTNDIMLGFLLGKCDIIVIKSVFLHLLCEWCKHIL